MMDNKCLCNKTPLLRLKGVLLQDGSQTTSQAKNCIKVGIKLTLASKFLSTKNTFILFKDTLLQKDCDIGSERESAHTSF